MKAICKQGNAENAVTQAASALKGSTFIVYCADDRNFAAITTKLYELMPKTNMIGTTGFMFSDNGSFSEGIAAIGFEENEAEVYVGTMQDASTCPINYLPELRDRVEKIHKKYKDKDTLCLEFATGYEEKMVSTMKICLESVGMRLLGGTSGNTGENQPKKVACNGKVFTDAVAYAVIGSKMGKIEIVKENLFRERPITHRVTRVSNDNRTVLEIDGRKAMDVYEEELGYSDANVGEGVFKNPLCRIVGTENYITAIFSFNPDRSISTYKNVMKNDLICFTDIEENYQDYMKNTMSNAVQSGQVAGIISINCILRYLFFENNSYTSAYARMMQEMSGGIHFGMVGDGEQYVEQHVNQSMVCAVFMNGH